MVAWSPIKKNVRDFPCLEVRSSMRTFLLKSSLFDSVCIQVVYERATTDLSSSNLRTKTPCCGLGSQTEAAQRLRQTGLVITSVQTSMQKRGVESPQCSVPRTCRDSIRHGICVLHHTQRERISSSHKHRRERAPRDKIYLLSAHFKDKHRYDTHNTRCR